MKTLFNFRFLFGFILLVSVTSCKKDWTCQCSASSGDWGQDYSDVKRSVAKQRCDAYEAQVKSYVGDPSASCSIK